jgi:hypothetical protein
MEEQFTPVIYGIERIVDCGFSVEEAVNIDPGGIQIGYGMNFVYSIEENWIQFTIRTDFKNANNESFFTGTVLTKFSASNLTQFLGENGKVFLPVGFPEMLFGISFSHMRAILAKNIAGTKFSSLIVPIINPTDLFSNLLQINIEKFKEFAQSIGAETPKGEGANVFSKKPPKNKSKKADK